MSTIEKQLELEKRMVDSGAQNYINSQRHAERDGRGAELDYSRKLMKEFMLPLIDICRDWIVNTKPGRQARVRVLLRTMQPEVCMFIAMKCLFNSFMTETSVASIATSIGKMIEDEIRFSRFQETHKDYYDTIIEDFKRKGSKDYRYMHRVLTHKANEHQHGWIAWTQRDRIEVGTKMLDIILSNTTVAQREEVQNKGKTIVRLAPTEEALLWIKQHENIRQFLYPEQGPCIIAPDPWTAPNQGGYYSPQMRAARPMIKTKLKKAQQDAIDWTKVMDSINIAQDVPWQVNTRVLDVAKQVWERNLQIGMPSSKKLEPSACPVGKGRKKEEMNARELEVFTEWCHEASAIYTADRERVAKSFQVSRIIRMASEYRDYDAFWYVWYADSRGRIYTATAGFSPQGPDLAKGLIQFKRGMELGPFGYRQLKILGANRFGYDKDSYDGRVAWIEERHERIVAAGLDPLAHTDVWSGADKPYQFLAFCIEYAEVAAWIALGNPADTFVSYLSAGLDGSCNGLQNFSAMLRDAVGGKATNLVPSRLPNDIYGDVAKVTIERVQRARDRSNEYVPDELESISDYEQWQKDKFYAAKWLEYGLTRKDVKRPVMTLPYGSTQQSCTKYLFLAILERDKNFFGEGKAFSAAVWLTKHVWAAIGDVVIAATEAMEWLQKCATAMNRINKPLAWKTADGFVAYQHSTKIETVQIETKLAGRFRLNIGAYTDELDKVKQRLGVAPNFVHSMDATHLRMTIRKAKERGITDLALIHDDYGTHCANTHILHEVIRETFVELYGANDPIQHMADVIKACGGKVPPMPKRGTLDLNDVLKAEYFFG